MTTLRHGLGPVLCAAAAFVLTACSSTSTREPADLTKVTPQFQVEKVWSVSLGDNRAGLLTPSLTSTGIYAAGASSLYKIDPATGKTLWEVPVRSTVTAGVGSDGHTVALGTASGQLAVFDETGKALWSAKLSAEMVTPPLVGAGVVLVRTSDTRISCYDAVSGERRWRYQTQSPALSLRVAREMRFSPAGVLVGENSGRLLALDATGKPVFEVPVSEPKGTTEVDRLSDVVGAPMVDATLMCAASYQGRVLCISAEDGHTVWTRPVDAVSGSVTDGSYVYVTASDGALYAFDHDTGTPAWTNSEYRWRSVSAPVVTSGGLAFGDYDGVVSFLDTRTGQTVARSQISGASVSAPVPFDGGALFQTDEGKLVFLRPVLPQNALK